jgi:type I restriction enzyme S subunit
MKNGWKKQPFENCIDRVTYTEKVQRRDFLADGAYPIVSQEEDFINGYWDNEADLFKITTPVVVFGDHTKVLKYVDFDFVLGADGVKILQPRDFLLPKFFYYQLQAATLDSLGYARHYKLLKELEIVYPTRPEQQRIVGILDEAFERIATARANAEKNLHNARALFESHLQSVFSKSRTGWVEKELGDESLLEIVDGDRGVNYPKASDFHDAGHCLFLNTKNVRPDGFDFETAMFISAEKDRQLRKGKLKRDDVVMTTRGTIGNIGLYSDEVPFDNIRINSGMLIFRSNGRALLPSFLFELLRSEIVKNQIKKQTTGAAQPQLPIKTLVNFTIPVPTNLDDQRALVKKLRAFEPETQHLAGLYERKLVALEALKKSVLHQAFTGEL